MAPSHGFAAASHREAALRGAPASHGETAFRGAAGFCKVRHRHAVHPSRNAAPPPCRPPAIGPRAAATAPSPTTKSLPLAPAGTASNFAWSGKKTATLYRGTGPADPVLVQRQSLGRSEGAAMVAVWKSDLVGSDIDPLHGVFGERAANRGWGALVSAEPSTAPPSPDLPREHFPVTDPKRTAKPDQRHRQGKREIMGLVAVAVTVSQDRI